MEARRTKKTGPNDTAAHPDAAPKMSTYEDLLELVGTRGPWNILIFLICCLEPFLSALTTMTYQFTGATPDHWCSVEPLRQANWTQHQVLNFAIPISNSTGKYESCYMYDHNYTAAVEMGYDAVMANRSSLGGGSDSIIKCYSRDFNFTQYQSTIVTEWDLVCERRVLYSSTQSVVMGGKLVGYVVFGYVIDVWGRRPLVLLCALVNGVSAFLIIASPNEGVYIFMKGLCSMASCGLYLSLFVLMMENCATRYRAAAGALHIIPWSIGYMTSCGIAYLVRTWKLLQLVYALPSLLQIVYFVWLPESPRWLIVRGRYQEALKVMMKGAKVNGKTLPPEDQVFSAMRAIGQKPVAEEKEERKASLQGRVLQALRRFFILFILPEFRVRTLVVILCWFASCMVYYGLALNANNINTDPYLHIFIGGFLEIPSTLILWVVLSRLGRRRSFIALLLVCAVTLFLVVLLMLIEIGREWAVATLSLLGKMVATIALQLTWIYTAELYPTKYRSRAVGMGSCFARVGAMCSPYINDILGMEKEWGPSALFGSVSLVSAAFTLLLPETRNLDLAEPTDFRATYTKGKEEETLEDEDRELLSTANPGLATPWREEEH